MATQNDVALRAQVSYMTVSRVVNNVAGVKPATRERVLKAIEELGYSPNSAAQVLAGGRTFNVGIVFPENEYVLSRQYFVELTNRIELALRSHGYKLFLGADRTHVGQDALANLVKKGTMDGLLLVSPPVEDDRLADLSATNFPTVLIHASLTGPFTVLDADSLHGTALALDHLGQLGHRDIAFVTGNMAEITAQERLAVFRQFLEAQGTVLRHDRLYQGDYSLESGYAGFEAVWNSSPRPTAVLFSNDQMAIGGLKAAHDRGVRVPGDVSIVGYDNTVFSAFVSPALTTVDMRIDELARASVEALLDTMNRRTGPRQITIPTTLVVRESTSAPRKNS